MNETVFCPVCTRDFDSQTAADRHAASHTEPPAPFAILDKNECGLCYVKDVQIAGLRHENKVVVHERDLWIARADRAEAERDAEKRCADQIADLYNEIVDVIGRENPETDPGTSERVRRIVADNARLREAIENAPHNDWCAWLVQNKTCNCWKAAALAAGEGK